MYVSKLKYPITFYKAILAKNEFGEEIYNYDFGIQTKCALGKVTANLNYDENLHTMIWDNKMRVEVWDYVKVSEIDRARFLGELYSIESIQQIPFEKKQLITLNKIQE